MEGSLTLLVWCLFLFLQLRTSHAFSVEDIFASCKADITFVLDGSGSVGINNWDKMLGYVRDFAGQLQYGADLNRFAVVSFGNEGVLNIALNQYATYEEFTDAVSDIRYLDENTNTASGIRVARTSVFNESQGARPDVEDVMIILTDGVPTYEVSETIPESDLSRDSGIDVFVLGIGEAIDRVELFMIGGNQTDRVFYVDQFEDLIHNMQNVLAIACPSEPVLNVSVTTPPQDSTCYSDITFVLDGSGSVGIANWEKMLGYVRDFAGQLDYGPDQNHLGVVSFGNEGVLNIALNQYATYGEFADAVSAIEYLDENTNTASGIRVARTLAFNETYGARPDVEDVMIILTDGVPTYEVSETIPESDLSRDSGIDVFVLGIGEAIDRVELFMIGGNQTDRVFYVDQFEDLMNNIQNVLAIACPGGNRSTVTSLPKIANCTADIAFVLDGSGSVMISNWMLMLQFVKEFTDRLEYSADTNRFGVVSFGNEASMDIMLNQYATYSEFATAVDGIAYKDENTNTAAGIRTARSLFTPEMGDRENITNYMVILTDGIPTYEVDQTIPEAQLTWDAGIEVFSIGIGPAINQTQLFMISRNQSDHVYYVMEFMQLMDNLESILTTACGLIRDTSSTTTSTGTPAPSTTTLPTPAPSTTTLPTPAPSTTTLPTTAPSTTTLPTPAPSTTTLPTTAPSTTTLPTPAPSTTTLPTPAPSTTTLPTPATSTTTLPTPAPSTTTLPTPAPSTTTLPTPAPSTTTLPTPVPSTTRPEISTIVTTRPTPIPTTMPSTPAPTPAPTSTLLPPTPPSGLCGYLDMAFIVDSSGSIETENWLRVLYTLKAIIDQLTLGATAVQVAVINYSSEAFLDISLGQYTDKEALNDAIDAMPLRNQLTNTSGALKLLSRDVFNGQGADRPDAVNVVLLITDGYSNKDAELLPAAAEALHASGTMVYVIGVGNNIQMQEMRMIASEPSLIYMSIFDDFQDLASNMPSGFAEKCAGNEPEIPEMNLATFPVDLVFVLGSAGDDLDNFYKMTSFIAYNIRERQNVLNNTNLGLVIAGSGGPQTSVSLDSYSDLDALSMQIGFERYQGATYNVADAVEFARTSVFNPSVQVAIGDDSSAVNGDRPDAGNALVVMTTGLPEGESRRLREQMQLAIEDGILVYLISADRKQADLLGEWYLEEMASKPYQIYEMFYDSFDDLENLDLMNRFLMNFAPKLPWSCSFEDASDQPTMCNITQSIDDDFDWTLNSGETPSKHTGPTAAKDGSYYTYIEASSPRENRDLAELLLPSITLGQYDFVCLHFYYHMRGFHIGTLQVFIFDPSTGYDEIRWQLYGPQSDDWEHGMASLYLPPGKRLGFRALRGGEFSGDIAIDKIRFTDGLCSVDIP